MGLPVRQWVRAWLAGPLLLPVLLLIPLFVLTALRISGTSIGFYHQVQYGSARDPDLLVGRIRGVRSDEWLVNTQMTVAQVAAGLPVMNRNIGDGQDMAVVLDVPNLDWSFAFRPHNWSFAVLPLEYAFAFKWWVMLYFLVVAGYSFVLTLVPGRRLLASIAVLPLAVSPFVLWWYQDTTILTLAYALAISTLVVRLLTQRSNRGRLALGLLLVYFLVAFAFIIYPPFQIGVALAVVLLGLGLLLESVQGRQPEVGRNLATVIMALALSGVVTVLFVVAHRPALSALAGTVYPGSRVVTSGGQNLHLFLANHLLAGLQFGSRAVAYPTNQSEASNFVLLCPYLLLPSAWTLLAAWRKEHRVDWPLLTVNAAVVLFLAHMFVAWGDPIYRLLFLDKVPHNRLLIAVGLAGFLQVALLCRHYLRTETEIPRVIRTAFAIAVMCLLLYIGVEVHRRLPGFLPKLAEPFILAPVLAVAVYLVLTRNRQTYGLALWAGVSAFASLLIMPLYVGLGPLQHGPLLGAIAATAPAGSRWIADGNLVLEHLPLLANRRSYSGVYSYPQLALWREIDGDPQAAGVYNRYAHVQWTHVPGARLEEPGPDQVLVHYTPCDPFVRSHVDFIISLEDITSPCSQFVREIDLPAQSYRIYRITH